MRRLVPLLLLGSGLARAHDADVIYVNLATAAGPGVLAELATLTQASLGLLAPLDADGDGLLTQADLDARRRALEVGFWDEAALSAGGQGCTRLETSARLREGFVELGARFRCGEGELRQDFRFLRVLPPNYRVVLGTQLEGEAQGRGFAQGSLTTVSLPRPPPAGAWDEARFCAGLEAGVRRLASLDALTALVAIILSALGTRGALAAVAAGAAGAVLGSALDGGWSAPTSALVVAAAASLSSRVPAPALALALGFALGARGGGGSWVPALGVAAGTLLGVAGVGLAATAVRALLQGQPRALASLRWALVVGAAGAAGWAARLSW